MLPRPNRLQQSSDFDKVYKKGRHYRGKYGKLIVFRGKTRTDSSAKPERFSDPDMSANISTKSEMPVRIGIVVPGKQGKATVRNRAKRQIREVFKRNLDKLPGNCDITFICWNVKFDYSEIEKDITVLIRRL